MDGGDRALASLNREFWPGKRILLTGHTGFKGGWAAIWLTRLGAQVTGLSLPPDKAPNLYDLAVSRTWSTASWQTSLTLPLWLER